MELLNKKVDEQNDKKNKLAAVSEYLKSNSTEVKIIRKGKKTIVQREDKKED